MDAERLLKLTTLSDMRKSLLYKLIEGPASLVDIKEHFNITSANAIPRLKDLTELNLVIREDGKYRLTSTGLILAKRLRGMDSLAQILVKGDQFLNGHDLSPIPDQLLERIDELGDYCIISNEMDNITATHDQIYNRLPGSKQIIGISPVLTQSYPEIYLAQAKLGIPVSLIVTEKVLIRIEANYSDFLESYLSNDNAKMYAVEDVKLALVVTNDFLSMYLYNNGGSLDIMNSIITFDESATKWGVELFAEYLGKAREIKG
ncbi:helix-turn-helix transcriptional regulator [Methanocella sp. MCL-LM]|uniref:helix-turn-helix transcriptional regulator n=1 Tax=Methanocella sp. MCL-LM TaxID=3412035 RepID=UPI003C790AA2